MAFVRQRGAAIAIYSILEKSARLITALEVAQVTELASMACAFVTLVGMEMIVPKSSYVLHYVQKSGLVTAFAIQIATHLIVYKTRETVKTFVFVQMYGLVTDHVTRCVIAQFATTMVVIALQRSAVPDADRYC